MSVYNTLSHLTGVSNIFTVETFSRSRAGSISAIYEDLDVNFATVEHDVSAATGHEFRGYFLPDQIDVANYIWQESSTPYEFISMLYKSFGQSDSRAVSHPQIFVVLPAIWLVGVVITFIFSAMSALQLHKRFQDAIPRADLSAYIGHKARVFVSSQVSSPLTYGIFRPCIIIPLLAEDADSDAIEYMLMHELQHIRSKDVLINLLWVLALCVHWFNPLVWLGWVGLRRDMETKCDAKVLKQISAKQHTKYAQTLLNIVPVSQAMFPLAFASSSAKDRIKRIITYKPASKRAIFSSLCVMFLWVNLFASNPSSYVLMSGVFITLSVHESDDVIISRTSVEDDLILGGIGVFSPTLTIESRVIESSVDNESRVVKSTGVADYELVRVIYELP